jgi:hypothetical protein
MTGQKRCSACSYFAGDSNLKNITHDIFLGWPVSLVGRHKDILFAIVEEVYDPDLLEGENTVESTLGPPIRSVFISIASFD